MTAQSVRSRGASWLEITPAAALPDGSTDADTRAQSIKHKRNRQTRPMSRPKKYSVPALALAGLLGAPTLAACTSAENTESSIVLSSDLQDAIQQHVGLDLEDFTAEAHALGFEVRVAERDGEALNLKANLRIDRINVATVDDVVTRIVMMG